MSRAFWFAFQGSCGKEPAMAEKDITEKKLEDFADVFADIVNVLLFDGEERIRAEDLMIPCRGQSIRPTGRYTNRSVTVQNIFSQRA